MSTKLKTLLEEIKITKGNIPEETITEEELIKRVSGFNTFGKQFYKEDSEFTLTIKEVISLLEIVGSYLPETTENWFNQISLKKDSKRIFDVAKELKNINDQNLNLKQRATVLFEDAGGLLQRYFKIANLKELDDNI